MTRERIWWGLTLLSIGMLVLSFNMGCVIDLQGNGKVGFEQSTKWSFYHTTEIADPKQKSKSQLLFGPLVDLAEGLHSVFVPVDPDTITEDMPAEDDDGNATETDPG